MAADERDHTSGDVANELSGTVSGPVVQGRDVTVHYHAEPGPADPPRPRELPAPPAHFTGRDDELATLDALLDRHEPDRPPMIIVLVGPGGVGKSALLLHWLHRHRDRFPDGQLYVNLYGVAEDEPLPPSQVLARFLRALGTPPERVPATTDEQSALFRSLTSGRRAVVLADDAASAAQVRAILPGGGNLVAVTSRRSIRGLTADGAAFLNVGPLGGTAAVALLTSLIGRERALAEPGATEELARICGYLPIALRAAGIRLAMRRRWPVSRLLSELADERRRLSAMRTDADSTETTVRAVFDLSYAALERDAALLYRSIGPHPGRDFGAELAAASAGFDVDRAEDALDDLLNASLVDEVRLERFRMHDLIRIHAMEVSAEVDGEQRRRTTILRIVDWYLTRAAAADLMINPGRWRIGGHYAAARETRNPFEGKRAALDWLEAELPNLLAAQRAAVDHGAHVAAWQMCEALWGLFQHRKHFTEWIASHELGLAAARTAGDEAAESWIVDHLGFAYRGLGRTEEAERLFGRALALARSAGHRLAEAMAMEHLGLLDLDRGRPEDATGFFTDALQVHRSLGRPRGVALMLRHVGEAHRAAGRYADAERNLAEARRAFAEIADHYQEARSLTGLAETHLAAGDPRKAQPPLERALRIMRDEGAPFEQARIHTVYATTSERLGHVRTARDHLEHALGLLAGVDDRQAGIVRTRLELLRGTAEDPGAQGADE